MSAIIAVALENGEIFCAECSEKLNILEKHFEEPCSIWFEEEKDELAEWHANCNNCGINLY